MRDPFGRPITYLRLAVTDRCNLRCRYCVPEECGPAGGAVLSGEALVEIARQAVLCGVKKIRLTGGEPLVRRDIAALCRSIADLEGEASISAAHLAEAIQYRNTEILRR